MKKQKTQLIVVLVILLICVGGYFGLRHYNSVIEAQEAEAEYTILTVAEDDITQVVSSNENGELNITKVDGTWTFTDDDTQNVDQDTVSTMLSNVLEVTSDQAISDVTDMSVYGLDEPVVTITLVTTDGSHTLKFGDFNETNSLYYMQFDDETTVYTVSSSIYTAFSKTNEDLVAEEEEEADASDSASSDASTEVASEASTDVSSDSSSDASVESDSADSASVESSDSATESSDESESDEATEDAATDSSSEE
jgi:hypothetical protein